MRTGLSKLCVGGAVLVAFCCLALSAGSSYGGTYPAAVAPNLPLAFERNQGQMESHFAYGAHLAKYTVALSSQRAVLRWKKLDSNSKAGISTVAIHLLGADIGAPSEEQDRLPGIVNYFKSKNPSEWRTNIPTYKQIRFLNVYPKVDVLYYGNRQNLEADFLVAPGGRPDNIQIELSGAEQVSLTRAGDAVAEVNGETLSLRRPVAYQELKGKRTLIPVHYKLRRDGVIALSVGRYDRSHLLVIDPVLTYATYLGGASDSYGVALAVDAAGNSYIVGNSGPGFPVTAGSYQPAPNDNLGGPFIAKVNPSGTALLYSTYLGGSGGNLGYAASTALNAIAVDATGDAYVAGSSNSDSFPTTPGAIFQYPVGNDGDNPIASAVIAKLDPTGSKLLYSTFLGSSGSGFPDFIGDSASAIAVDASGYAYVGGSTFSTTFPVTKGAFQTTFSKTVNLPAGAAFVSKINTAGTGLIYSTFVTGNGSDVPSALVVDSSGSAYLGGYSQSTNFPVTAGAYQGQCPNTNFCGFVSKLNPSGSKLTYSTYLGGNGYDEIFALALDNAGHAYVTGVTTSTNFPVTSGAFETKPARPIFVTELNSAGTALVYSTFLDGTKFSSSANDQGLGIAVDASGEAYVLGVTSASDFPVTADALQPAANGGHFLTKLNSTGSGVVYSSYLLGAQFDALGIDSAGDAYVTGTAYGSTLGTTPGALQATNHSTSSNTANAVLEKISFSSGPNVDIVSNPSGESFTLAGAGCPSGTFTAPYQATWSGPCTVTWVSPDTGTPGTRRTFEEWADGDTANSRVIFPNPGATDSPNVADFLTEYQLTTSVNNLAFGQITPSPSSTNWFPAGTTASVSAAPNPGYAFTGFTGALSGETTPQDLVMNAPASVQAVFAPTPVSAETAAIAAKSGPANARIWTITLTNSGPGAAYNVQLVGFMFTQTYGVACTKLPTRTSPLLPLSLGNLKPGKSVNTPVTLDFSACPSNARFTVTIDGVANDGSSVDVVQLANQFE